MTHDEIVAEIRPGPAGRGVLTHYCPDSRRCEGDRGLPDLLLVGMYGATFLKVKTPNDTLRPEQTTWKHALRPAGQEYHVIRGDMLLNGIVDGILDGLALGAKVA